jgi:CubicO group peptidase (beta-lactamase class C family)/dienelactone hydrolase
MRLIFNVGTQHGPTDLVVRVAPTRFQYDVKPTTRLFGTAISLVLALCASTTMAQINPTQDGYGVAPDAWLLAKDGKPWWHKTRPSPNPVALKRRDPTPSERLVADRARSLMSNRPAKAFALMDGDTVIHEQFNSPADSQSILFGLSMGKTVTSMAVGQAICSGKLKLETKAMEIVPEISGKALGNATVRDLLRMASGTTVASDNAGAIWTAQEAKEWNEGNLNLFTLITQERNVKAARGLFSDYKPGEVFAYKSTDPTLLAIMVSKSAGMPWNQWLQEKVLDPMGAAYPGLYVQDRQQNGQAEAGMRMRLEDWMRFAWWVKRSSKETGCFGDYVRAALSKQINNGSSPSDRQFGKQFGGYGYFTWTDNATAPNTTWAWGYGGQKIGWHRDSDRMIVVFSNVANWTEDVYQVSRDWNKIPSAGVGAAAVSQVTPATPAPAATPIAVAQGVWRGNLSGRIDFQSMTPPSRWQYIRRNLAETKTTMVYGDLLLPKNASGKVPAVVMSHGSAGVNKDDFEIWAKAFNDAGYAAFVIDSFKPRGVARTEQDQNQVPYSAQLADALNGLRVLSTHPHIDARRIFHIGFSRGGTVSFESAWPTWRAPVNTNGAVFAGHVSLYPGMCNVRYRTDDRENASAPILMLLADSEKEDYQGVMECEKYADDLALKGNAISVKEYKGAFHAFDSYSAYREDKNVMSGKGCDIDLYMTTKIGDGLGAGGFDYSTREQMTTFDDFNKATRAGCDGRKVNARVSGDPIFRARAIKDVLEFLANPK